MSTQKMYTLIDITPVPLQSYGTENNKTTEGESFFCVGI